MGQAHADESISQHEEYIVRIITNNVPRPVINGFELSAAEQAEFDYLDFENDSPTFFRFKGQLHDLGDFERGLGGSSMPEQFKGWDNYKSDSFFSGLVIRYGDDYETVVVGTFYS
jgi:hypothetical protein